ncbi:MAG: ABC transporter substrate-binding protein [Candidatus Atribacteria bacterium]|nr:ABC transporter substrate-binding protein [Candidatus Atribacteria bacterium]MCK4309059.1 ABC transporter substrate-binding protein [Candidatus Atribacteria bacterium]
MKVLRKKILFLVILLSFGISLMGVSWAAEAPIKIGVVQNLTGAWASIDGPCWNGIQLAVDEINKAGGLLGRQVEAVCIDTKADELEVVAAVTRLIEKEKVSIIVGYCDTHWVLTAAPLAAENKIPFITPGATHPRIPERTGAWMACFGDNLQGTVMAEYAIKKENLKKVAVWVDTACDFSVGVCEYFVDSFKHFGGEVVYEDSFETNWTDYSSLVARLKAQQDAGKVDCVYVGGVPGNIGLIVKQLREGGVTIPILGEDGFDTPLLVEVGGKYAEGVLFVTHVSLSSPAPEVQGFVKNYKEKWGVEPENAFAALGYDTVNLTAQAIKLVGSAEPAKIEEGLALVKDFPGVTGSITFAEGSKVPQKGVSVLVVKNGVFETLQSMVPSYIPAPEIAD